MAREWGITEKENPATGVRKHKERPRDFYAGPAIWNAVYQKATPKLRDAMDLAYLTGQRLSDILLMKESECEGGFLHVTQGKTNKKLRIQLQSNHGNNELGNLIEKLLEKRRATATRNPYLVNTENGRRVSNSMLRLRFDEARRLAATQALLEEDEMLAVQIRKFQFRDIRPKAASEISDLGHASRLLGHTDKRITETVYRRVGEVVPPTR